MCLSLEERNVTRGSLPWDTFVATVTLPMLGKRRLPEVNAPGELPEIRAAKMNDKTVTQPAFRIKTVCTLDSSGRLTGNPEITTK